MHPLFRVTPALSLQKKRNGEKCYTQYHISCLGPCGTGAEKVDFTTKYILYACAVKKGPEAVIRDHVISLLSYEHDKYRALTDVQE